MIVWLFTYILIFQGRPPVSGEEYFPTVERCEAEKARAEKYYAKDNNAQSVLVLCQPVAN